MEDFAFDHFVFQLVFVGFVFYPYKCLAWVLFNMPPSFSPDTNFVVHRTTLGFWMSHLGLLFVFFPLTGCIRWKCLPCKGAFEVKGCSKLLLKSFFSVFVTTLALGS
jgi:hypothetical protein